MKKNIYILSLIVAGAGVFSTASSSVLAQEAIDCAQVENARERLACFDRKYPRDPEKPNVVPGIQSSTPRSRLPTETPSQQTPQSEVAAPAPQPEEDRRGFPSGGLLDDTEDVNINSTIAAVRDREKQKMVFRLENGQIWMQSSPRALPINVGDKITIKSGTIGGYIMSVEGGVSTRVQRIK
ncbi:MAG: hypothetical protein AAF541_24060 [Pseudomonadota bacterium]